MHMTGAAKLVRLCFAVLFGTMSLMHGPVMAYSGHHAPAAHESHGASHDLLAGTSQRTHGHGDRTAPVEPASCNSFACFLALEPIAIASCPLHAVLLGVMSLVPAKQLHAIAARPDLPPPRLRS
jgi:hypothetical protein